MGFSYGVSKHSHNVSASAVKSRYIMANGSRYAYAYAVRLITHSTKIPNAQKYKNFYIML
jgi:hypothetical protein